MSEPTLYISIDGGVHDGELIYNQTVSAGSTLSMGRASSADIKLPIEYDVAGLEHCRIRIEEAGIFLETLPLHAVRLDQKWLEEAEIGMTPSHPLFVDKRQHDLELGAAFRLAHEGPGFSPFRLRLGLSDRAVQAASLRPTTQDQDSARRVARSRRTASFQNVLSVIILLGVLSTLGITTLDRFEAMADRIRDEYFQDVVQNQLDDISNARLNLSSTHAAPAWVDNNKNGIWLIGNLNVNPRDGLDQFQGYGTAWVYQPEGQRPVLITNQHVINQLSGDDLEGDWAPHIRRTDESGTRTLALDWDNKTPHPHRDELESTFDEEEWLVKANVFDLASIYLADAAEDVELTEHALTIGDPSRAGVGELVGYIGYPSENLGPGTYQTEQPEPTFVKGTIARVTDLFGLTTEVNEHRNLFLIDMTAMGGASGSPLFDTNGNVIGIVSSGDVLHFNAASVVNHTNSQDRKTVRVPIGFTNAYGAHLVREFVDPQTDIPRRRNYWRETKSEIGTIDRLNQALMRRLRDAICPSGDLEQVSLVREARLDGDGWPASLTLRLNEVDVPSNRDFLFSANSSDNKPIGLGVIDSSAADAVATRVGNQPFAWDRTKIQDPDRAIVEVFGTQNDEVDVIIEYCKTEQP